MTTLVGEKRKGDPKENGKWHAGVPSAQHQGRAGEGVNKFGNKGKMDGYMLSI